MLLIFQFRKARHRRVSQLLQDSTVISSRGGMRMQVSPPTEMAEFLASNHAGDTLRICSTWLSRPLDFLPSHVIGPLAILLSLICWNFPGQFPIHFATEILRSGSGRATILFFTIIFALIYWYSS